MHLYYKETISCKNTEVDMQKYGFVKPPHLILG